MLQLFAHIVKLLNFSICEIQFFLSSFDISNHVRLRLVCPLNQLLVQFYVSFQIFYCLLISLHFLLDSFQLLLLRLESISKKQRLLDSSFSCCWSAGNRLNQSIADCVGSIIIHSSIASDVHDGRIQFFLDQLVISKSLFGYCELGLDISASLPCS